MVRRLNIDGDGQGDTNGHGGEQRAVLVYQIQSYRHWQRHFGRDDFSYGQFGENLTVDGLPDDEVCIGDRYRIGEAEFEVTQPRVTCYRVGLRLGEPELPALLCQPPPARLLHARPAARDTSRPATRSSRPGPAPARSAWPTPTRCSTCPAATRPSCASRAADPGAEPGLAGVVPRPAGRRRHGQHRRRPVPARRAAPAWAGFRPLRVTRGGPGERDGLLDLPGRRRTASPLPPPGPAST